LLDDRCLSDNIIRQVGDEAFTFFWKELWLDGASFDVTYARLFDLVVIKLSTVVGLFSLG